MPELNYNITANVEGVDDVETLAEDIGGIDENVNVSVTTTGTDTAKTDLGGVATEGEAIGTKAEGGASVLGEAMGAIVENVGSTGEPMAAAGDIAEDMGQSLEGAGGKAGILSVALSAIATVISIGAAAWQAFSASQKETQKTTQDVSDAINENVGALGQMKEALDDLIDSGEFTGFDAINQSLLEQDPDAFQQAAENLGVLGGSYQDVGETIANLQTDELGTLNSLIAQSGIPPELAASALELVQAGGELSTTNHDLGRDVNELTANYGDQIDALVGVRAAQDTLNVNQIAEDYLEAQRGVEGYAEMLERAKTAAGPDASTVDVFNEFVTLQAEAAVTAEEFAKQQEEAAAGARALSDAVGSVDWQQTEIQGATTAMSEFTTGLFAAGNEAQAREEAFDAMAASVENATLNFHLSTEAGRAQQDALEGVARVVNTDLATAYDNANGSQEGFIASATEIGEQTLARLKEELNLSAEGVETLRVALGLTEGDYQARFELAGAEEARLKLQLLSGAITGLPAPVEITVNTQILAGDYVGALATIQAYYADPANAPATTVEVEADVSGADTDITGFADEPRTATIDAEAETTQAAADTDAFVGQERLAHVAILVDNFAAARDTIDLAAADRTATVDIVTGSVAVPSAAELARRIGPVEVLIRGRWSTRIEGRRPI